MPANATTHVLKVGIFDADFVRFLRFDMVLADIVDVKFRFEGVEEVCLWLFDPDGRQKVEIVHSFDMSAPYANITLRLTNFLRSR